MASWDFEKITAQATDEIRAANDAENLEAARIKYLGRKGLIAQIYAGLPALPAEEKPAAGKNTNELKNTLTRLIDEKKQALVGGAAAPAAQLDITLPGVSPRLGHTHIIRQTIDEICGIFEKLGFSIYEGPEIETEFNNFTALNIPVDHPSRDAFDTFYLTRSQVTSHKSQAGRRAASGERRAASGQRPATSDERRLLRSHTSPAQIRVMRERKPPLAVVVPGKVYRPDAVDASHSFMFHQVEGLMVDTNIRFSDLKGMLTVFCKKLFGEGAKTRFRPHFFPFTEPSAEVDVSCDIWQGQQSQGKKKWLEILGCGMVHPNVFNAVGYPKGKYTGLAFGLGVERIAMLKYGIDDIRLFFENDIRFTRQF